MHMLVLPTCMYVHMRLPGAHRSQKRVLDQLELELKMIVSCHVVLGIEPGTLEEQPVLLPGWVSL